MTLLKQYISRFRKKYPWIFRISLALTALLIVGCMSVGIFIYLVYSGSYGKVPGYKDFLKIEQAKASEVYSADSILIGKYYIQDRTNVAYDQIAPVVIQALVATEDERFFEHEGVDNRSLLRVIIKTLLLGDRSSGGGSTLSQQLIKNLFPRKSHGMLTMPVNKVKEAIAASRLEEMYDKEGILSLYLNTVPFGENVYGIEAAAQRYFNTSASQLTTSQAATLIGMLKAPTTYHPVRNEKRSMQRRNVVLNQMVRNDYLDKAVADSLDTCYLQTDYHLPGEGIAPHFKAKIKQKVLKWCSQNTKSNGENYDLYTDGLKIYTTLDYGMQRLAEEAVNSHLKSLQSIFDKQWKANNSSTLKEKVLLRAVRKSAWYKSKKMEGLSPDALKIKMSEIDSVDVYVPGRKDMKASAMDSVISSLMALQAGFITIEPVSGHVKTWVGSADFRFFQYDHVTSKRQVGSTFKPFIYTAALMEGREPCKFISNKEMEFREYEDWEPENADDEYGGWYSMQGGLTNSVNIISIKLLKMAGIKNVTALAKNLGIHSEIPQVPSIALGTPEISLKEMAAAYTAYAADGTPSSPVMIQSITTEENYILFSHEQESRKQVLDEDILYMIREMMRSVVDSGTARSLRSRYNLHFDIAGKTGTTQDGTDGWFMGYTPALVGGVWVGADDPSIHLTGIHAQGARMALPIWAGFFSALEKSDKYRGYVSQSFPTISEEIREKLNCPLYKTHKTKLGKFLSKIPKLFRRKKRKKD